MPAYDASAEKMSSTDESRPGEQHNSGSKIITNPFEEVKPRISEYTAQEIATLQSRLEKQLGPEYISSRSGPSGQKVHYIAAEKCIQLANEVFGFNGWSSQIMDVQVDFVDENPQTLKVSLGLSVIVRVTLRDGTFHEDVGYGHMENSKGKAAAFEKAKKEGATDALKRALRNFGNVLGNCLYDKEYLKQVTKVKAQPARWNVDNLHRHSTFEPVKREMPSKPPGQEEKPQKEVGPPSLPSEDTFEDEFGDFDEADFGAADPDSHPDEVVLQESSVASSRHFSGIRNGSAPNGGHQNQNRAPSDRPQPFPSNAIQPQTSSNNQPPQPQTPNSGFTRASNGAAQTMRPPPDARPMPAPALNPRTGQRLNQPSRNGPSSTPGSPLRPPVSSNGDDDVPSLPPLGKGFFSARAATMIPQSELTNPEAPPQPIALPLELAFNPHAESPSIRKTPGVDHKSSRPVRVEMQPQFGSQLAPVAGAAPRVPGAILNPTLDSMRRIGAPTSPSMAGRGTGAYKPPTMKRPGDTIGGNAARVPLNEMPANEGIPSDGGGGDQKRQRLIG